MPTSRVIVTDASGGTMIAITPRTALMMPAVSSSFQLFASASFISGGSPVIADI